MSRLAFACVLGAAIALAACDKPEEAAPAGSPQAAPAAPPEPPKEVGESCSAQCEGVTVAIQCAEGETPVCDCAATPNASCVPPKEGQPSG